MHENMLVVCVKVNRKIVREFKDQIFIPFGAEYSILVKNLNSVRCQVRISVDGQDATEGVSLVINPKSEMELERFIKNGNMNSGNKFKFIERTAGIEQHRGIQAEDGLIRVEFQFEKVVPKPIVVPVIHEHHDYWYDHWYPYRRYPYRPYEPHWIKEDDTTWHNSEVYCSNLSSTSDNREVKTSSEIASNALRSKSVSSMQCSTGGGAKGLVNEYSGEMFRQSIPQNETGITVAGSQSNQQFNWVSNFPVESEVHVIVLKLLGETQTGKVVEQAVTVKMKQTCPTCGKRSRSSALFCPQCGTSLMIV